MRMVGLHGARRRRWSYPTRQRAKTRRTPVWCASTSMPGSERAAGGGCHLHPDWGAVTDGVPDVFNRRIVGWVSASHLYTELMPCKLDILFLHRRREGVILHSDQGTGHVHRIRAFYERSRGAQGTLPVVPGTKGRTVGRDSRA
jgi:transposase InsO family protein